MTRSDAGPVIVWFRSDLRVNDNPALVEAAGRGTGVIGLYILEGDSDGLRPHGAASLWWLHHSLERLREGLDEHGIPLILRRGSAKSTVLDLVEETSASAVLWNRRYGPAEREVDADVKQAVRDRGADAESFAGSLMFEPWTILTKEEKPYSVYSPFYRAILAAGPPRKPLGIPDSGLTGPKHRPPGSDALDEWALLPTSPDWAGGLRERWTPGEPRAREALHEFIEERIGQYGDERDKPAVKATSDLSPHLRWGEVSPHEVWHAVDGERKHHRGREAKNASDFLGELGWREFCYNLYFYAPDLATKNWRPEYDDFPWAELDPGHLKAWQKGRTGVPLVDAGMRELWDTGYMHNRVRMVTASFLIKNLLIDWREGERWFWDTLVDADPANNAANWQWVAGSGADAAPFFRVFNPVLQAQKFDPKGEYIARHVPEIDGEDYPEPIVDLKESRQAALDAYQAVKR